MFKRRMKLNVTPAIIIKSCSYRVIFLTSMIYCFTFCKTTYSNVPLVIKFQKPFERPSLELLGLHFKWKCATFSWAVTGKGQSWKTCMSTTCTKEPGFQLGRFHLPHHTDTERGKQQGPNHLPGKIAMSPHQNAFAERLLQELHTSDLSRALFACSFGLLEAKQNPSPLCHVGAEPEHCTRTRRRERECLWLLQDVSTGWDPGRGKFKEPIGQY